MTATYKLHINELISDVVNSIKETFKNKQVEIIVSEEVDETEYLLRNLANQKFILESSSQLRDGKGINFSLEEFQEKYSK